MLVPGPHKTEFLRTIRREAAKKEFQDLIDQQLVKLPSARIGRLVKPVQDKRGCLVELAEKFNVCDGSP